MRERARSLGLPTADKPESQEICFVPDGDYAKLVERVRPQAAERGGEIVDARGRVLGRHRGVHRFTVGQRHGLGIASDRRLYVQRIEPHTRRVVVGDAADLDCRGARIEGVSWVSGEAPSGALGVRVQVRHRHRSVSAKVDAADDGRATIRFDAPVRAVAPGQAAVLYAEDDEQLLGGGWIVEGQR